jgi:hypothetical protein
VKTSKRGNTRRGSVGGTSGKTGPADTDFLDAQIPGAAAWYQSHQLAGDRGVARNGKRDKDAVRWSSLPGRENLCKWKLKGVARMKQGGQGRRWNKASRGIESLKA